MPAPRGTAGRPGAGASRYTAGTRADGAAGAASGCRPGRAPREPRVTRRWARRPRGRGRRPRPGRRRPPGRGGEPVGARLVGDHLRDPEADQLVQGVGDRAGRPGEYLADLVRGEGRLRELAQVLLDQVAQRAGPGRGGAPAAGGGLDRPPPLGGQVAGGLQGGEGDVQVPGREGFAGLVGGLGDGRDGPGGLSGDGRVRPRLGADVRLLVPGGAVSGGRGGLAGVGRGAGRLGGGLPVAGGARDGGLGGRGLAGAPGRRASRCRRCRAGCP